MLGEGWSIKMACEKMGISYQTGLSWKNGETSAQGYNWRQGQAQRKLPNPTKLDQLSIEARACYHDFARFRQRYLGRSSTPWQKEAATNIVKWIRSPETELVVINCPPGSGKSTLFTHDIPAWLLVRDRSIRIMIGSSNLRMASSYSGRIRRTLERTRPLEGAEACVGKDYGRFKPDMSDLWRREEFVVLPMDGTSPEDKEPTVSAFGMDTEFLGTRANFVVWDDLVTNRTMATEELVQKQRTWWDTEGETRLEPGGCLVLQGQRMGPEDLYRYALSQQLSDEDEDDFLEERGALRYRHIIYPAHFEDRCHGDHGRNAMAFPDGCLLDPSRLPWRGTNGLATIKRNKESKYRVQYQQEDVDPESVLIPKVWIDGGRDADGVEHPGCLDRNRKVCELPSGLERPLLSICTADPSPTKYWSVQWWIYQPSTQLRFLMDMYRGTMNAPDFLDRLANGVYVGLVEDWQRRSVELGHPITNWIVENNAAQRFLLQYDFVKSWQRVNKVQITGHTTAGRVHHPLEEEYGIGMLKNVYRYGQCRLPYGDEKSHLRSLPLITEATHYTPGGPGTTDCLMAQWFLEFHLPKLYVPTGPPKKSRRPSWVREKAYA